MATPKKAGNPAYNYPAALKSPIEKAKWRALAPLYKLDERTRDVLIRICRQHQIINDADQEIRRLGLVIETKGGTYANPAISIRDKAQRMLGQLDASIKPTAGGKDAITV